MSIPTSLIVVLLVVAWLVVLVPMVARRREKVPQTEATGSGFRVLRRASASLRRRPRPRRQGPDRDSHDAAGRVVGRRSGAGQRRGRQVRSPSRPMPPRSGRRRSAVGSRRSGPASAQDTLAEHERLEDTVAERDVDDRHTDVITVVDDRRERRRSRRGEPSTEQEPPVSIAPDDRADAGRTDPEPAQHPGRALRAGMGRARGGRARRAGVRRRPGRAAPPGPAPAGARRLRPGGGRGHPRVPVPAASPDHADPADRHDRVLGDGVPVRQLVVDRRGRQPGAAGRLPELPASSGADRGRDPAEADGAAAAGPADPARVRPPAGAGPAGRACRPSRPAARWSTSTTTIPGSTTSRNTVSR